MSYPPNENDDIGDHTPLSLDRYGITNINDVHLIFKVINLNLLQV